MRFAGETTCHPRASIRGMQQHNAPEENGCLVVDEGFPVDEVIVPVKILRRRPQSCEGLCNLQEKRLVTKGER
jgi:hypothetical protein